MTIEVIEDPPIETKLPQVELVAEDGVPVMESAWHVLNMLLLIEVITELFRGREDYWCGGNQFIYFNEEQARNRDFRGPDFYLVLGVPHEPIREYWCVWQEGGRYPNVIIELLSPSTAHLDRTTKKAVYEKTFRTPNYYCYDRATQRLEGWQLRDNQYQALPPDSRGWLWCDQLQLWLGTWHGRVQGSEATWLRFFDADGNLLLTGEEAAQRRAEQAERDLAHLQARLAELEARAKNGHA